MGNCGSSQADEEPVARPKPVNPLPGEQNVSGNSAVESSDIEAHTVAPAKKMKLKELRTATEDFSEALVLGEGSFGKVYKGVMADPSASADPDKTIEVAVKKLNPDSFQGYQEWLAEVLLLDRLRHPNLVRLVGYCNEKRESLLVYELCAFGNLEEVLFEGVGKERSLLTWPQRLQIAIDITAGLNYLHKQNIIHRDFKASNILLVEGLRAKVTDFGLAKAGPDGNKTHVSTRVMGTLGYLDPTYMSTGRLTKKSDTYALGVTFLELLTGRKSMNDDGNESLTTWVKPHLANRKQPDLQLIVDERLGENYSKPGATKLMILAKHCVNEDPDARPELDVVLTSLTTVDKM